MWFILQQFLQVFLYCSSIYNRLFVGLNWYPVSIDLRDFALTSARLGFPTGASKSYTTSTWIVSSCHLHILVPSKYFQGTKYDYFACLFFPWNSVSHKSDLSMIFPQLYFFLLLLFLTEPHLSVPHYISICSLVSVHFIHDCTPKINLKWYPVLKEIVPSSTQPASFPIWLFMP